MVETEILPLKPDIVTLYAGHNDIRHFVQNPPDYIKADRSFFLFYDLLRVYLNRFPSHPTDKSAWTDIVSAAFRKVQPQFNRNLLILSKKLRENNIPLLVVKQKMRSLNSQHFNKAYSELYTHLSHLLEKGKFDSTFDHDIIIGHYQLMEKMNSYSKSNFYLLDGIQALDGHDDGFVTDVHLNKIGNTILANAMKEKILEILN